MKSFIQFLEDAQGDIEKYLKSSKFTFKKNKNAWMYNGKNNLYKQFVSKLKDFGYVEAKKSESGKNTITIFDKGKASIIVNSIDNDIVAVIIEP